MLEQVTRIINERLEHPPGIRALATEIGLSPSHLRLVVRRTLGMSLGQYMLRFRLNQAQILLSDPTVRIGEAARRCGFGSAQAFSRAFRHATGGTPRALRKPIAR